MAVLDTTFLIDLDRQVASAQTALRSLVKRGDRLLVPPQVAIEYLAGVADAEQALERIIEAFTLLDLSERHVLLAARMARDSAGKGGKGAWSDLQVAAAARLEATFVATADVEAFRRAGVPTWDYRASPADPPAAILAD